MIAALHLGLVNGVTGGGARQQVTAEGSVNFALLLGLGTQDSGPKNVLTPPAFPASVPTGVLEAAGASEDGLLSWAFQTQSAPDGTVKASPVAVVADELTPSPTLVPQAFENTKGNVEQPISPANGAFVNEGTGADVPDNVVAPRTTNVPENAREVVFTPVGTPLPVSLSLDRAVVPPVSLETADVDPSPTVVQTAVAPMPISETVSDIVIDGSLPKVAQIIPPVTGINETVQDSIATATQDGIAPATQDLSAKPATPVIPIPIASAIKPTVVATQPGSVEPRQVQAGSQPPQPRIATTPAPVMMPLAGASKLTIAPLQMGVTETSVDVALPTNAPGQAAYSDQIETVDVVQTLPVQQGKAKVNRTPGTPTTASPTPEVQHQATTVGKTPAGSVTPPVPPAAPVLVTETDQTIRFPAAKASDGVTRQSAPVPQTKLGSVPNPARVATPVPTTPAITDTPAEYRDVLKTTDLPVKTEAVTPALTQPSHNPQIEAQVRPLPVPQIKQPTTAIEPVAPQAETAGSDIKPAPANVQFAPGPAFKSPVIAQPVQTTEITSAPVPAYGAAPIEELPPQAPAALPEQAQSKPVPKPFAESLLTQVRAVTVEEGRTTVQLHPRGLGTIEVEMRIESDIASKVIVRVENPAVLNTLRDERQMLAQTIGVADSSVIAFEDRPAGERATGGERQEDNPASSAMPSDTEDKAATEHRNVLANGALDVLT